MKAIINNTKIESTNYNTLIFDLKSAPSTCEKTCKDILEISWHQADMHIEDDPKTIQLPFGFVVEYVNDNWDNGCGWEWNLYNSSNDEEGHLKVMNEILARFELDQDNFTSYDRLREIVQQYERETNEHNQGQIEIKFYIQGDNNEAIRNKYSELLELLEGEKISFESNNLLEIRGTSTGKFKEYLETKKVA